MQSLFRYTASPSPCGYLPDQVWSLEYEYVGEMTEGEYLQRMLEGWRRFGTMLFRPACPSCTRAKLALYDRYHAHQSSSKGWPEHPAKDAASYADSFVHHPFPVEEWTYFLGGKLVGVGYVDFLPHPPEPGAGWEAGADVRGLSAIYFFYDPEERDRSLGTWNVLCLIDEAVRRGLPYVYLGYYVPGCPSMEYKPRFVPNQIRGKDGGWRDFRTHTS
jgi:arginyl-tRNA--protein-N-Asp/Glu arginylyltransferase